MFFNLSFSVASFGLKLSYHVLYTERPKADLVFQKWKENGEIKGHRQSDLANEASRATFTLLFEVISAPLSHASWNRWQPPKLKVCSMSEVESNQSASFKNFSRVQGFGTPSRFFFPLGKGIPRGVSGANKPAWSFLPNDTERYVKMWWQTTNSCTSVCLTVTSGYGDRNHRLPK